MADETTKRMIFSLNAADAKRANKAAKKKGLSLSAWIRMLILRELNNEENPQRIAQEKLNKMMSDAVKKFKEDGGILDE